MSRPFAAAAAVGLIVVTACGGAPSPVGSPRHVSVFAAASLRGAFDTLARDFVKAHPDVSMHLSYAGSSTLATQISNGAAADVFASADQANMAKVTSDPGTESVRVFAHNSLEIAVAPGNPRHIASVSDLARRGLAVVTCARAVPCGSYAGQLFARAHVTVHPKSEETDVGAVVRRVAMGEADAGIVYLTDIRAAGNSVTGVAIPANENVVASYPMAVVKKANDRSDAEAFLQYVLSSAGQAVLQRFGFQSA